MDSSVGVLVIVTNGPRAHDGTSAPAGSRAIARRWGCTAKTKVGSDMGRIGAFVQPIDTTLSKALTRLASTA